MAECSTPRRRVFNSLRAGTASMRHNPLMFSSSATAKNSEPHLKRAREAGVRYTTYFSVRGTAVLHSGHDPAAGGHRHQSVWFLANQTVTPQMLLPHIALRGYVPSFFFFFSVLSSTNQGGFGRPNVLGWNLLVLVK